MTLRSALLAGLPALVALAFVAPAQARSANTPPPARLEKLPYSGGLLMARGIRAGTIHLASYYLQHQAQPPSKHCAKNCALKNVDASSGTTQPVDETPIAVNPLNRKQLITGGNDYNCGSNLRGFWTSSDGGKTWTGACGVDVTGQSGDGDPIVGYDLNGNVYQGGIESGGVGVASSSDNGKTWNNMVIATSVSGYSLSDKPWLQIDTDPNSPYANTLYVSNTQFATNNNTTIYVSHSTDAGQTWSGVAVSPVAVYPNINQFSDMTTDASGNVYVTYMNCTANDSDSECGGTTATMYIQKSSDGGNTWSSQVAIGTVMLAPSSTCGAFYGCLPNTDERVSDIPAIGADNSGGARSGQLYVVEYNWTGTYMQVQVTSSSDGGNTWSTPDPVAPASDTHDQFFPWLNVDRKGNVGVTWLDRRNDPNNVNYEAFATWSANGGASFKKNVQIADTPSDPFDDGFGSGFMGDYSGNAWFGKDLFAAWTDCRNGSYSQDEIGGLKR